MAYSRREFIKLLATSALGGAIFSGCQTWTQPIPAEQFLIQSSVDIPEDLVTGTDNYYATACQQCMAGCGILVRIMEGRAKKIEGNPDYPINRGKHCARAEASLQAVYHPDRLSGPLKRSGDRGAMKFQAITWDAALDELVSRLRELQQTGQTSGLLAINGPLGGHRALIMNRFCQTFGATQMVFEATPTNVLRTAIQNVFGQNTVPDFGIEGSNYIVSFGADFLSTWLSPVRYGREYGNFRQGHANRGTLVQIEPNFSPTAASADIWVPIRPGSEGILALSMAQVIVAEGLGDSTNLDAMLGGAGSDALAGFQPEQVAQTTGVDPDQIRQLARDFANSAPSLAIGGGPAAAQTNGLFNLEAVYALNFLVGNVGKQGGIIFNPPSPVADIAPSGTGATLSEWQQITQQLQSGQPQPLSMVLLHRANPVYGLPSALQFGQALGKTGYIVSFSSFIDETTALADLILPTHEFLEDWGDALPDPGPGFEVVGFQQPVVRPVGDSRGFADLLLTLAEELGGDMQMSLPWDSLRDALRDGAQQLQALGRGSVRSADFEDFWNKLLQHGGWWDENATVDMTNLTLPSLPTEAQTPDFAGSQDQYPFNLIVYQSNSLLSGQLAHLPWLQALPDPTSTVVWQSWLEINPRVADQMGVQTGDLIVVESPQGSTEVPAYVHPATPPEIVAMPAGQGHSSFTRYATGRGNNPQDIVAPQVDTATGMLAYAATRVRLRKTGQSINLARFEGSVPARQLPDSILVPTAS